MQSVTIFHFICASDAEKKLNVLTFEGLTIKKERQIHHK